jgi:hypothetical protein
VSEADCAAAARDAVRFGRSVVRRSVLVVEEGRLARAGVVAFEPAEAAVPSPAVSAFPAPPEAARVVAGLRRGAGAFAAASPLSATGVRGVRLVDRLRGLRVPDAGRDPPSPATGSLGRSPGATGSGAGSGAAGSVIGSR